jgi:glycerol-3-phosphate acyltransferase PlsY
VLTWDDPEMTAVKVALFGASVIVLVVSGYLLGSINFAIIISSTQYKQDIRNFGSNNAGMTNMMRTYGKKAAAFTFIGDVLKAVVACLLGHILLGQLGAYIAGLFCILGHIFPIYYKFKGGKGVLCTSAMALILTPIEFLILLAVFVILVSWTKYVSLGSVTVAFLYPIVVSGHIKVAFNGAIKMNGVMALITILLAIIIVYCHRGNLQRISEGTERKISFKSKKKDDTENG